MSIFWSEVYVDYPSGPTHCRQLAITIVPILWRRGQYSYVFFIRRRLLSTPRIR
jgi:hypothetical protein